jgi:hypothetical protein
MSYKIDKFNKLLLNDRYTYSFHVVDNNCTDIKVGDDIEIDGINGEVEALFWFMKSFERKGDNVSILVKPKINVELTYEERIKWFIQNHYESGMEYELLLISMKNENLDAFKWYDEIISIPKFKNNLHN